MCALVNVYRYLQIKHTVADLQAEAGKFTILSPLRSLTAARNEAGTFKHVVVNAVAPR